MFRDQLHVTISSFTCVFIQMCIYLCLCVCPGVQQLVQQQMENVLMFHSTVSHARANMETIRSITQVQYER